MIEITQVLGAGRKIMLMGDSTMEQAASTLMNAVILGEGGCQERIVFEMGDTVIHRGLGRMNRGSHWLDAVHRQDPDFVVLSAGAHITADYELVRHIIILTIEIQQHQQSFLLRVIIIQ